MIYRSRRFDVRFADGTVIRNLGYSEALAVFDQNKGQGKGVEILPVIPTPYDRDI